MLHACRVSCGDGVARPGGVVCQSPSAPRALGQMARQISSNLVKCSSNARQISSNARLGPLSNAIYPRSPVKSPPSRPPRASQNTCKSAQKGNTLLSRFGIVAEPLSSRIYCGADLPSSPFLCLRARPRSDAPWASLSNPAQVAGPWSKPSNKPAGPPGPPSNPSKARQNTDRARAHTTPPC